MAIKKAKQKTTKAKSVAKNIKKTPKTTYKEAIKPAQKGVVVKSVKKMNKPVPKKEVVKSIAKKVVKKTIKSTPKKVEKALAVKPKGRPIDAIAKKGLKQSKKVKKSSKKGKKSSEEDDDEEQDLPEEEVDDSDVDVKDDYEKTDDEDIVAEVELDEVGLVDLEGATTEIDEDEDEIPEKRGRGRRKKNDGKISGGSMESYIRNRPLQIDINKPLIKKSAEVAPKPFLNTQDNRTRYTDKELAEFKELILVKLNEAQIDYDLLKQTLSNEDDHGTDDTSPTFKLLEDGSDVMSKEETAQLAQRQEKYIVNLKNALVRIENKSYGICRVTGKLIPKERLRSVPHATLGIDAKLSQNN
jgi:DnaK suppressor protein